MFLQFTYKHGTIGPELLHNDFFLFGELSHKQTQIDFDANQNNFDMPHKSFVLIIVISPKCNTANPSASIVEGFFV